MIKPHKWDADVYEKKAHGQRRKRDSGEEDTPFFSPPAPAARNKSPLSCPQIGRPLPELITLFFM